MRDVVREERLRATAGLSAPEGDDRRMTAWRGRSGRRYVMGIHPVATDLSGEAESGVLLAVKRSGDGEASVVEARGLGLTPGLPSRTCWFVRMSELGATEIHFHLLARSEAETQAVLRDLSETTSSSDRA